MQNHIAVRPLSSALGAEITGLDLTRELSAEDFRRVRFALTEYQVVVVRDADITTEDQLRFARMFGELEEVKTRKDNPDDTQYVLYVANRQVNGSKGVLPDGEMFFHSDQCYYEKPCCATLLNALQLPSQGGDTLFASMTRAYRTLPEATKKRLAGLRALNRYDYEADPTRRNPHFNPASPHWAHPVVIRHPDTGAPALFVNRQMTHHILGMPHEESEELLLGLFDHAEAEENVYEHVWSPRDLVIWDNRAVLHARRDFDPREARILRRTTVKGDVPAPA